MQRRRYGWLCLLVSSVLLLSACAGGEVGEGGDGGGDGATEEEGGGEVSVAAVWTGSEQESFEAVLDAFTEVSGVETSYQSSEDLGTFLG
ncbi:MAG: carbohydrate ABC transporter substrate-binding protein, partial [Actinomycetota bacterium]|nr:carbohydrate ABC transporter substrate-binding protein [Actinomycetota bacterium]